MPDHTPTGAHEPAPAAAAADGTTPHAARSASTVDPDQTTDTPTTPDDATGMPSVPGYDLLEELGRGGMGVVYKARQCGLNRAVALKMIRAATGASSAEVARFLAEAEAVASVRHPNVVQVFECGRHAGQPYMALEYFPGGTLVQHLRRTGKMDARATAELVAAIASGVQAAHSAGIVHRDLKPANILLADGGASAGESSAAGTRDAVPTLQPKVTDFGIARRGASDLTATGAVVGTPHYMAPEQAAGRAKFVGPQADVWALGVILFECLTGSVPFRGESAWEVVRKVLDDAPPPVRRSAPATPRDLELICLKCLEKEPTLRYLSAAELGEDLHRFLDGRPVTARPLGAVPRVWRAVKRNPVIAGAVLAVLFTSTVGAVVSLIKANEAAAETEKLKKALEERDEKETERAKAAEAEKLASAETLRNSRLALYARELGDARRWAAEGDVPAAEQALEACPADLRGWEWRFVRRWLDRRAGHLHPVIGPFTPSRVAVSPDGRWVAVGGMEHDDRVSTAYAPAFVWLWDLSKGGPPAKLPGQFIGPMGALTFDPDGRLLAAVSGIPQDTEGVLRVWSVANTTSPVLELKGNVPGHPVALRFGPGAVLSTVMASADPGSPTKLVTWALADAKAPPTETEFPGRDGITCAAFAPGGTRVVLVGSRADAPPAPSAPQYARVFDTLGKPVAGPVEVDAGVRCVAFAPFGPAGRGVVFGVHDIAKHEGCLAAWDGEGKTVAHRSPIGTGDVTGLHVRADGKVVPVTHPLLDSLAVQAWDPATGAAEVVARFAGARGVACFPDGRRMAVGTYTGVRVWNPADYHEPVRGDSGEAADQFALLTGDRLALFSPQSLDGIPRPSIRVGRLEGGLFEAFTPESDALGYSGAIRAGDRIALAPDAGFGKPAEILLYDPATRAIIRRWRSPGGVPPSALAADAGGGRIAFGAPFFDPEAAPEDRGVKVYGAVSGKLERSLVIAEPGTFALALVFSPDGKYLAAARAGPRVGVSGKITAAPGGVTVWDAGTGDAVFAVEKIAGGALGVAYSPDASLLAVVGGDRRVRVWSTTDWKLRELPIPSAGTRAGNLPPSFGPIEFSPDGSRLVAGSGEAITVWDVASGQPVLNIPQGCTRVGFTTDGRRLVLSAAGRVLVCDAGP
jgi:WD40 repeat protein